MLFLYFLRPQRPHPLQLLSTVKSVHKMNFTAFIRSVCKYGLMLQTVCCSFCWLSSIPPLLFLWDLHEQRICYFSISHWSLYTSCWSLVVAFTGASIFLFILGAVVAVDRETWPTKWLGDDWPDREECAAHMDPWRRTQQPHTEYGNNPRLRFFINHVAVFEMFSFFKCSPEFLIQYEDLLHQPGVWTNLTEVAGTSTTAQLSLSPHVYYSFRVLAMNRLGYSNPSQPSNQYRTNPAGAHPQIKENFSEILLLYLWFSYTSF